MNRTFYLLLFTNTLLSFSQTHTQYPDAIIDSYNSRTKTPDGFYGGRKQEHGAGKYTTVALDSLLHKTNYFVSLPKGSYVTVGFTDNYIIDAPNQNDIFIEEVGGAGEYAAIFVSSDNIDYTLLAVAGNGLNKMDLASIQYTKPVRYIKIVGKDDKGASPGFDVGDIYGLPGSNKRTIDDAIVLENVLFETNKAVLLKESSVSLDKLVRQLNQNKSIKIEIMGHTDNLGNKNKNQILSEQRAQSVLDYLIAKGIEPNRLSYKGFGSTEPIATNDNEEGRKKNRRVTFLEVK